MELHQRIDTLCKQKGVSGAKMASELGLSRSSLSELRSGRIQSFRTDTMRKIAQYFGITVDQLLDEMPFPKLAPGAQFAMFQEKIVQRGLDFSEFNEDDLEDIADFMMILKRKKNRAE